MRQWPFVIGYWLLVITLVIDYWLLAIRDGNDQRPSATRHG
jgi:hypothetical protein